MSPDLTLTQPGSGRHRYRVITVTTRRSPWLQAGDRAAGSNPNPYRVSYIK